MKDIIPKAEFEQLCCVWRNGIKKENSDPCEIRMDECGAVIRFLEHGEKSEYGWEIEHSYPESLLQKQGFEQSKIDDYANLRPMHWKNNASKSDNYPTYHRAVTWDGSRNVGKDDIVHVDKMQQTKVHLLYGDNLIMNPAKKA